MEKLPVSNSGPGWLGPGSRVLQSDQGGSLARRLSPSHLAHLELASGALGSQEVLTLHDSLNSELGFLGKGDDGAGVMLGGGGKEGCSRHSSSGSCGPEGGAGCDLRGAPTPGLGIRAGLDWGWGRPSVTLRGRNHLPVQGSSLSLQEEGWALGGVDSG